MATVISKTSMDAANHFIVENYLLAGFVSVLDQATILIVTMYAYWSRK